MDVPDFTVHRPRRMLDDPFARILGASSAARAMRTFGNRAAAVDAPVLLLGESGTGKGVLARAIHDASARSRCAFVAVNCAAVPDALFESEFFGHVRGAFTGAQYAHKGLMEQAHGGTLFLDEVGELPLVAQAKLLTAIEDRQVRRVGGERVQQVNVRIIAATACDLVHAITERTFRRDLFHRLSVLSFNIAPLRHRIGDLPILSEHILLQLATRYQHVPVHLTNESLERLAAHDWPGNVRELANALERAVLSHSGPVLPPAALSLTNGTRRVREIPQLPSRSRYSFAGTPGEELTQITHVIAQCRGNKTRAAEALGMSRNTLLNKLRRLANSA
jgi:transcriptional regulator with PAS, ATPase and Fis domain